MSSKKLKTVSVHGSGATSASGIGWSSTPAGENIRIHVSSTPNEYTGGTRAQYDRDGCSDDEEQEFDQWNDLPHAHDGDLDGESMVDIIGNNLFIDS